MATVDGFELDDDNIEFDRALQLVRHGSKLIYLTGKAGTGKTTFLKYLKGISERKMVILAPTGVAAVNAGGETIHSFFQIKPGLYEPNDARLRTKRLPGNTDPTIFENFRYRKEKLDLIRSMDLMVIDEVSMVRCDLLDVVDRLLRVFRKRGDMPFGGVQTLLIGDTFQLLPVAKDEDWNILRRFYKSSFFFGAKVIEQNKPIYIELKKIYRQKEEEFIALLNRIRVNEVSNEEVAALNSKYDPTFEPPEGGGHIILGTHNAQVHDENEKKLKELSTPVFKYEANINGEFPESKYPTERSLELKVGAQVMFLKNNWSLKVYNGSIGQVSHLTEDNIEVCLPDNRIIYVEKYTWQNIRYEWDEASKKIKEKVLGSFEQYPLRLAWAITVHKSQGLTFDKVVADLGGSFASGQVYVALSRCTSSNGLVLRSPIHRSCIKTSHEVIDFAQHETPETLVVQELNYGKANALYAGSLAALRGSRFEEANEKLVEAVKLRNDLGTDRFKKAFITTARQLTRFSVLFWNVHKEAAVLREELSRTSTKELELTKALVEADIRFVEQTHEITHGKEQIKTLEELNKRQRSEMALVGSELERSKSSLLQSKRPAIHIL